MKRLSILLPALLAACGTPQEQCISAGTRDLRTVESLIAASQSNLKRGYAIDTETRIDPVLRPCLARRGPPLADGSLPPPQMSFCRDLQPQTVQKPVAIDLEAEASQLKQLQAKRKELLRDAEKYAAACRAKYPE